MAGCEHIAKTGALMETHLRERHFVKDLPFCANSVRGVLLRGDKDGREASERVLDADGPA